MLCAGEFLLGAIAIDMFRFRWSYMFQIEECQVNIQYKSHLVEFQHHVEEVQRFFINQVRRLSMVSLLMRVSDRSF